MTRRLKSFSDVRRYLAGLINRVEAGELEEVKASRLTYISNVLLRAIECNHLEELDKRLTALEAKEGNNAI
jgi:hypothetical protein